jgi:putative membrane protein insertion efficiency factor
MSPEAVSRATSYARWITVGAVRAYQGAREGRLSPCRYVPSCSEYATEAVTTHGVGKGLWLAAKRIARCNPLGGRGFDPVPS